MAAQPQPVSSGRPMSATSQIEVLDLRHFSAARLRPLLQHEAVRWQQRLRWDYAAAITLLLDYIDGRILPGFVALNQGRVVGYAFCVFEAAKAVIGDVYAFDEGEQLDNPICETLLHHLLEMLQATPGVDRIESQLLMFPAGALVGPFLSRGFRSDARLFMTCDLTANSGAPRLASEPWERMPAHLVLEPWRPQFYDPAAALIHSAYTGNVDSNINDQYRSVSGAQRFLHNIIRFPGCGIFDPADSWVVRDARTHALEAMILCSRVRQDAGHITQLCVRQELRRQGIAEALLHHGAAQIARRGVNSLSLTVTEANAPALRLYERNGFSTLHRFEAWVWQDPTPRDSSAPRA
jgi:GNAT superfamily N-acetyltransferase